MVGTVKTGSEGSFESTPAFLALSDRIAETESTLASLSSTVEGLTQAVASLQSGRKTDTLPTATSLGSIASDDDARVTPGRQGSMSAGAIGDLMPSPSSSLLNGGIGTGIGSGNITDTATTAEPAENASAISANSDNIAALMQQVAALSMSVAQLQKIQHTQVQLTRSNSGSAPSPSMSGLTAASAAGAGVAGAGGVGGSVSMGGASGQGSAVGLAAGAAGIDRGDNVTPTPGAVGTIGARGGAGAGAGGRPTPGVIGGGQAGTGANMGSTISRSAAPTQLGMGSMGSMAGLTSSPSGPLPSTLLSPPLSSTGPAGRRLEQNRPGMGRSISSSVINSHLASPGLGPGQIPGAGQGQGGDDAGSRWQGHGHGPLSPSPTAFNPIAGAGAAIGAAAKRTGGPPGHLQMPSLSMGMAERVWSPGGMMTPRVEISQAAGGLGGPGTPTLGGAGGMGMGGGAATPGAGIVVTKWDHLNLKPELLRGIVKYGIGPPNKIQARVLPFMLRGSDIIAQAPPTQERIIAYVIPSLQLCLSHMSTGQYRGPTVIIVTTTVDQATQCQKLVRNIGGPLGIRSALVTGVAGSSGIQNEIAAVQRDAVHLLIGTPAKLNEVVSARGPMGGSDCRLLVLDEVDQLIARNLYDNVLSIAKFLPAPRRGGATTPGPGGIGAGTIGSGQGGPTFSPAIERVTSPYDAGQSSPFNPNSKTPFPGQSGARFGGQAGGAAAIERQTCIFSNTIPTDVINFSQSLNVRDPVRVLVRRDGGPNSQESVSSVTPGINLKHTYVYLTITGSAAARADASATVADGPGAIGSGRSTQGAGGSGQSEEANRAKEYKLDILGKLLDDYPMWQAVVHVGTFSMLEAVVYKLQSRQWETTYLSPDMPPAQKKAVLQQWRLSSPMNGGPRFMVIFDVNVKPPEVPWAPLIINFDLPRSVEGYAARAAAGVPPGGRNGQVVWQQQLIPGAVTGSGTQGQGQAQGQAQGQGQGGQGQGQGVFGVIVSFVQAAGGDVEMLRSTECAYRFKSAEIPSVFHDLF